MSEKRAPADVGPAIEELPADLAGVDLRDRAMRAWAAEALKVGLTCRRLGDDAIRVGAQRYALRMARIGGVVSVTAGIDRRTFLPKPVSPLTTGQVAAWFGERSVGATRWDLGGFADTSRWAPAARISSRALVPIGGVGLKRIATSPDNEWTRGSYNWWDLRAADRVWRITSDRSIHLFVREGAEQWWTAWWFPHSTRRSLHHRAYREARRELAVVDPRTAITVPQGWQDRARRHTVTSPRALELLLPPHLPPARLFSLVDVPTRRYDVGTTLDLDGVEGIVARNDEVFEMVLFDGRLVASLAPTGVWTVAIPTLTRRLLP